MRLLDGGRWTHSSATDIKAIFRAQGYVPPEARAQEAEAKARTEGALRAMKRIQEETK